MQKKFFWLLGVMVLFTTGAGCLQFGNKAQGPMGIYQSSDKGESWKASTAWPTVAGVKSISGLNVYRLHNDPSDPKAMYIATRGQGVFYTLDSGVSWQNIPALDGKFIYGLAVDPKSKCTVYVSDGQHIFKTTDCLRSWNNIYSEERPDQRVVSVAVDYVNSNLIYAAVLGGDILNSTDGGKSWKITKRFGFQLQYLISDPFNPGRVWAAAYQSGLYRSDNGSDWNDLSPGLENYTDANKFYRLVLNPGKKDSVFWISKYGILKSDDAGNNWTEMKLITPPGSVNIYSFAINGKNQNEMYYTGTILGEKNVHVRSTLYKTTDGGKNWVTKKLPTNTIPVWMLVNPDKDNVLSLGFATL